MVAGSIGIVVAVIGLWLQEDKRGKIPVRGWQKRPKALAPSSFETNSQTLDSPALSAEVLLLHLRRSPKRLMLLGLFEDSVNWQTHSPETDCHYSGAQSVVPGQAAFVPPGNLLEMHIFMCHPGC